MYTETATGDVDTIVLSLDTLRGKRLRSHRSTAEGCFALSQHPQTSTVQATYSGAGSLLDPPSPPVLNVIGTVSEVLLGDVNLDGVVNFLDIAPFVTILSVSGFQTEADVNQDDLVNFLDISPFISILTGQ